MKWDHILYWFECLIFVICAASFCFVHEKSLINYQGYGSKLYERIFWFILRVGKLYSRTMRASNILGQKSNGNVVEPGKVESKTCFSHILHHSNFIWDFIQNRTNTEKIDFSDPTLPHPITFHLGFYLKIFDSVVLFKSRVSQTTSINQKKKLSLDFERYPSQDNFFVYYVSYVNLCTPMSLLVYE